MGMSRKMYKETVKNGMREELSVRVRELRAYLELSQAAFAEPLGLSPTHIARFEKGISVPSSETIDAICKAFSVDRRYFEHGEEITSISIEEAVEKKNPEEGVAERLKIAREAKGWSQNELAKRADVNQATINRVEFGAKLTEKQAVKLAETLEVGVDWLLKGDENKKRFPVDRRMIHWLWLHEDERCEIWNRMCESVNEEQ